jgi:hypothetical protein
MRESTIRRGIQTLGMPLEIIAGRHPTVDEDRASQTLMTLLRAALPELFSRA